jgi:hypothetical protein
MQTPQINFLVCWCGASSLDERRICLLVLASVVILWFESRGTRDRVSSQMQDSRQNRKPDLILMSPQEQDDRVIPPGTGFPFRSLLRLSALRWKSITLLHEGFEFQKPRRRIQATETIATVTSEAIIRAELQTHSEELGQGTGTAYGRGSNPGTVKNFHFP